MELASRSAIASNARARGLDDRERLRAVLGRALPAVDAPNRGHDVEARGELLPAARRATSAALSSLGNVENTTKTRQERTSGPVPRASTM